MSSPGKSTPAFLKIKNASVVVVRTEWNAAIVDELFAGCKKVLTAAKIKIVELVVPGAFEIPFAIKKYWDQSKKQKPSAFIALGCVIRGGTPHFEYVCRAVTDGVAALNLTLSVPSVFGVLTVDNLEQAKERIGGIHGHKGEEAAEAAMKMIYFSRSL
jgi:6,7-dimethyl-8-ribityllumazine synthase